MKVPDGSAIPAHVAVEIRAAHGDIWYRRRGPHEFLLRCPDALMFRKYSIATDEEDKPSWDEREVLVKHAVVYPAPEALAALLDKRGMLIPWLANEIARIGAGLEDEEAKKA